MPKKCNHLYTYRVLYTTCVGILVAEYPSGNTIIMMSMKTNYLCSLKSYTKLKNYKNKYVNTQTVFNTNK